MDTKELTVNAPLSILNILQTDPLEAVLQAFMLGVGSKNPEEVDRFKNIVEGAKAQKELMKAQIDKLQKDLDDALLKQQLLTPTEPYKVYPWNPSITWFNQATCNGDGNHVR